MSCCPPLGRPRRALRSVQQLTETAACCNDHRRTCSYTTADETFKIQSCIFRSCILEPCKMVLHFPKYWSCKFRSCFFRSSIFRALYLRCMQFTRAAQSTSNVSRGSVIINRLSVDRICWTLESRPQWYSELRKRKSWKLNRLSFKRRHFHQFVLVIPTAAINVTMKIN